MEYADDNEYMYRSLFGESPPDPVTKPSEVNFQGLEELIPTLTNELMFPFPSVKLNTWQDFTRMTDGFRTREFTILCGATGIGKTTLLANWSAQLHLQGEPHFIASVETGATDFLRRVVSVLDQSNWNTGEKYSYERVTAMFKKHGDLLRTPGVWLSKYTNRAKVEDLIKDIKLAMELHKVKIAMIDNLNFFMEVTNAQNALVEMDRVIHELIIFCKEHDIHIIMVMHPRKMEGGRVESEFDIKGSSTAVQEAHNVLLFNRPHPDFIQNGMANQSDREITIAKMRRRGRYIGSKLILGTVDEVKYTEKKVWTL